MMAEQAQAMVTLGQRVAVQRARFDFEGLWRVYQIGELHEDDQHLEIVLINPGDPGDTIRARFERLPEQPQT
ncbi:MAG TPA: hypothetical protein VFZ66_04235 [Herpetosiphonaceae bacterium]